MNPAHFSPQKRSIAAAAVTAALLGAFGTGAYVVAKSSDAFNPKGLAAAYESGTDEGGLGFRMNHTGSEGDANRHEEESSAEKDEQEDSVKDAHDAEVSEPQQAADDAFSQPQTGSVTTSAAYNVTGEADGTGVTVENGGTQNNNAAQENGGNNNGGTVIVIPDAGNKDNTGEKDNTGGNTDKDDPEPTPTPDPDPEPTPTPTETSYELLPTDPSPDKGDSIDTSVFPNKAGEAGSAAAETASDDNVTVTIEPSYKQQLYQGQKLDAWTLFCSLSTVYGYTSPETGEMSLYRWDCSQEEFDTYPYFQVVSWTDEAGDVNPELCPAGDVTVNVRYRFAEDGTWREKSVAVTPVASRAYFLGQEGADGTSTILGWSEETDLNLLSIGASHLSYDASTVNLGISLTERALRDAGYVRDDDTLTHLFWGWQEAGVAVGPIYQVEPGRHVLQTRGFSALDEGYSVHLQNYFVQLEGENTSQSCTLQTLINVDESVLEGDGEKTLTLNVPNGVQAVDEYREQKDRAGSWYLSDIVLPESVLYFNVDGPFIVQNAYHVDEDNLVYAATEDGVLTSKDGAAYLAVPAALDTLDVPAGVKSVKVQQTNALDRVVVHGTDGAAPTLQTDNLNDCLVVVDDDVFDSFVEKNYAGLAAADDRGVTVCLASDESVQYTCSGGMVYSEDDLLLVHGTGSDTVFVQIPTTIKAGAFECATGVHTVVLFNDEDCVLEPGSLAGGSVQTIVCFTEEQAAHVKAQLAAAGAPDARVILAQASQEDMLYYVDGETVTLLSDQGFATSFDGSLTAENGNKLQVNVIAPYAFAGDTDLAWVTLGDSVTSIGAYAFQNCGSLQGLFIGTTGDLSVGTGALEGCDSLGFVASLASDVTFASTEKPNNTCSWYHLPGAAGYDGRFIYIEDFNSLSVEAQEDGSLLLYAAQEMGDAPTVVVSAGSSYNGTLTLPDSVVEIYTGAFAGVGGEWDIDWESAPFLTWIDRGAFKDSGYAGDVVIDGAFGLRGFVSIGTSAFEGCGGITSVAIDVDEAEIGYTAFAGCTDLASFTLFTPNGGSLATGAFTGCPSLQSLVIYGEPVRLALYTPGLGFCFTDAAEDDEQISLTIDSDRLHDYLDSWIYAFMGYSSYDEYYSQVEMDLLFETFEQPAEAQVRERMAQNLLEPENRLRRMMGIDEVEASTVVYDNEKVVDGFTFSTTPEGAVTLVSAPTDAVDVNLDDVLPEGCDSLTVAAGAFETCENLERIELGSAVTAIESGALAGCDGAAVVVPTGRAEEISLSGGSTDAPFSFGADIALEVAEDDQQALLAAWPMRMLGCTDELALGDWAFNLIWDYYDADDPSAAVEAHINEALLEQENYLRGLMSLDPIESTEELAYAYSFAF